MAVAADRRVAAIATIFVKGLLDPNQWLSLGIAVGIVATGFGYYFGYLRSRAGTHLLLLEVSDESARSNDDRIC